MKDSDLTACWWQGISDTLLTQKATQKRKKKNFRINLSIVFCQSIPISEKFPAVSLKNKHASWTFVWQILVTWHDRERLGHSMSNIRVNYGKSDKTLICKEGAGRQSFFFWHSNGSEGSLCQSGSSEWPGIHLLLLVAGGAERKGCFHM